MSQRDATPADESWLSSTPAAFRAALERSRVTPTALAVPCPVHDADPGVYCWAGVARGVCGERISRGRLVAFKEAS
jgi:hypothetical protein